MKAKGDYNKALEKSGFSENIKYYKQGPVKRVRARTTNPNVQLYRQRKLPNGRELSPKVSRVSGTSR